MKKLFLYLVLFVGLFMLCYILANKYYRQENSSKTEDNTEIIADSVSPSADAAGDYIVGIRNGCVIVYQTDTDHVFEYTEIDADLLRTLHPDIYENLLETLHFQNQREMYRFLESLSS